MLCMVIIRYCMLCMQWEGMTVLVRWELGLFGIRGLYDELLGDEIPTPAAMVGEPGELEDEVRHGTAVVGYVGWEGGDGGEGGVGEDAA
jgi:hypothetical protein